MVNFIFVTSLFLNAFIIPLALFVGPIMLVILGVTLLMEYWENRDDSKGQARENTL
jgi:putative Mn2+ efflux pump MntP